MTHSSKRSWSVVLWIVASGGLGLITPAPVLAESTGPQSPKVLWVHKSEEQFIARPIAGADELYISGLGKLNSGSFHALALDAAAKQRVRWSKTGPYLKLPVVSAPAVDGEAVIFGDGMHQTDGATLHAVAAATGRTLWQYPVPGELVHMEGTPVAHEGRVYMGAGDAGVICVDSRRLSLNGAELSAADITAKLEKLWKAAQASYEEEKKKDPDFAVPPSRDALPAALPKLAWQQGQGAWHVDAGVTLAGDKLLVCTSFLDTEKKGERAVYCLSAADGSTIWKAPLKYNPWGAPRVVGDLVVVGTSNIRFDPKDAKKGRGEIVALGLDDGKPRWNKVLFGGVVSPLAVQGTTVVSTATDGRVQAYDAANQGKLLWGYPAGAPLFAGAAVAGDLVYAADIAGLVHAINLADGKKRWTLDLGTDPAIAAPGMVYGTPLVHNGRLYVATCNVAGEESRRPCVVVCLGDK